MKGPTVLLLVVLAVALAQPTLAGSPRSETRHYVVGVDAGSTNVTFGTTTYHIGEVRFRIQPGESEVHLKITDRHGQNVAAMFEVQWSDGREYVRDAFCGEVRFNLPNAVWWVEVTFTDRALVPELIACKPASGTVGTIKATFT